MKLPKLRPRQLVFQWDSNHKRCQYWSDTIGQFFEEATASLTGGRRFATENGVEYCPDVAISPLVFAESKSVGRGGRMIMYESRLQRELKWCIAHQVTIDYYIWRHRCDTKTCETETDVLAALASTCENVVVLGIVELAKYLDEHAPPSRIINNYGRMRGWHVPFTQLMKLTNAEKTRQRLTVLKHKIKHLPIHYYHEPDPF